MDFKKAVGLGIVIFMALSVFGYIGSSFFSEEDEQEYNGFFFYRVDLGWGVKVGDTTYRFTYLPEELANISMDFSTDKVLFADRVYLIREPGDELDANSAMNILGNFFYRQGKSVNEACAFEAGCPDIPIKDCSDDPGVLFVNAEGPSLKTKDLCIVLQADNGMDLNKLSERLIFSLLGIM